METILQPFKVFFERVDHWRDEILFVFIKPYWPRAITPNEITLFRVGIAIILFILLFFLQIENKILICSLFFIGAFSDMLDGSVARGLNKITEFGIMMDLLADRLLILPIAIYILFNNDQTLLLYIFISELINALVTVWLKSNNMDISSNIFGKIKMFLQALSFVGILFYWPSSPYEFFIDSLYLSIIFCILSIFLKLLALKENGHVKFKNI